MLLLHSLRLQNQTHKNMSKKLPSTLNERYARVESEGLKVMDSSQVKLSLQTTETKRNLSSKQIDPNDSVNSEEKQCRICLERKDQMGKSELCTPCHCTGSVKYLHELCFVEWITKSFDAKSYSEKKAFLEGGSECQICKQKIKVDFHFELILSPCEAIWKRIRYRAGLFAVFVIIILLTVGAIAMIAMTIANQGLTFERPYFLDSILLTASLTVVAFLIAMCLYFITTEFLVENKLRIQGFKHPHNKEPKQAPTQISPPKSRNSLNPETVIVQELS